ncbi:redoxin domain-containing protein [Pigmentiphaga aceris]|uniref:Redoxin domain-containing protein n=1 Tax=Pigmentiphaga aceris TaxID=1940612 RepID=A0A5C0B4T9_9BURK|nr:redoxin domain-containing protein [Pigmentiphaga aceris]QEI08310.1 redoxin domain-containing protein [Pigmentiphaga aceris]
MSFPRSDSPAVSTLAPELDVLQWFNTDTAPTLASLRGRVVVLHAFQMLCPGCVSHGLPQAMKIHHAFSRQDVQVLGLHTVFEHHAAMAPHALQAFLHEYRIAFPVGVDRPLADGPVPSTMQTYALRGTPSLVVIDRQGVVRLNHFGLIDDLPLGALIGTLVAEQGRATALSSDAVVVDTAHRTGAPSCDAQQCAI